MRTGLDVKRIEGTCRSPLYAHLAETMEGLASLHAFPGAVQWYTAKFQRYQNDHTRAWYAFVCTSRWLGSRLDMIVVRKLFEMKRHCVVAKVRSRRLLTIPVLWWLGEGGRGTLVCAVLVWGSHRVCIISIVKISV